MVDENKEVAKQPESDLIKEASATADRLEKANAAHEELLNREERLQATRILGGKADAGMMVKTQEEVEREKTQKLADEMVKAFRK